MNSILGWAKMVGAMAAAIIAVGGAATLVGNLLPYAHKEEVEVIAAQVTQNRLDILTNRIEWMERRLWDARKACREGDTQACDHVRDLERQIRRARDALDDSRRKR